MNTLYIVATPIGNLEDITLRAIRILKEVDFILSEDTRVTKKLLDHYQIKTPTLTFNAHASEGQINKIIEMLRGDKNLALVSDAGTPTISDPGSFLVNRVREEFGGDISVIAIPGPSALTAALSVSGIPSSEFHFLGFIPTKKGRQKTLKEMASSKIPTVFYESSHRIEKLLEELKKVAPSHKIIVAKELTKIHERVFAGEAGRITEEFKKDKNLSKGEFVVVVSPQKRGPSV